MPAASSSDCKSCQSANQRTFNGEIAIHFRGLEGLDKPIVWVFPKTEVCLNCGFSEFMVPDRELQVLIHGKPVLIPSLNKVLSPQNGFHSRN
jgi:hypothetical protein